MRPHRLPDLLKPLAPGFKTYSLTSFASKPGCKKKEDREARNQSWLLRRGTYDARHDVLLNAYPMIVCVQTIGLKEASARALSSQLVQAPCWTHFKGFRTLGGVGKNTSSPLFIPMALSPYWEVKRVSSILCVCRCIRCVPWSQCFHCVFCWVIPTFQTYLKRWS